MSLTGGVYVCPRACELNHNENIACKASTHTHTHAHTLRIGCTELKAVPHASLGYHFLRVQVRTTEAWGSSKGEESKVVSRNRDDRLTTVAHNCGVHDGSLKIGAGTSVSVPTDISVQCKPLRWAGTCMNNQPPCFDKS